MLTVEESIRLFLTQTESVYIKNQVEQGIRASGDSARSLRVEAKDNKGQLWGSFTFRFQKEGRGPGPNRKRPPLVMVEAIKEWIYHKRLNMNPWAVATSIMKKGTRGHTQDRFRLHVNQDVQLLKLRFIKNVTDAYKVIIMEQLKKIIKPL